MNINLEGMELLMSILTKIIQRVGISGLIIKWTFRILYAIN